MPPSPYSLHPHLHQLYFLLHDSLHHTSTSITSITRAPIAIIASEEWSIIMLIVAWLIREQNLSDTSFYYLGKKAEWVWSLEPSSLVGWRLCLASLHSSGHHGCHELCCKRNDKVLTKHYQGDRKASEYRHERQTRWSLDLFIIC